MAGTGVSAQSPTNPEEIVPRVYLPFIVRQTGELRPWIFLPIVLKNYPPPIVFPDRLIITEVLFSPAEDHQTEWWELFNPAENTVSLDDYLFTDEETPGGGEDTCIFPQGYVLAPK